MSTFRVSPFAPANETASDLYIERLNFDGYQLGAIGYGMSRFYCLVSSLTPLDHTGVTLVVAAMAAHALWGLRQRQPKFAYILLVYVFVIFALGTIGNAANIKWSELGFIENREFPGGPNAFFVAEESVTMVNLLCLGAYIVATWMQDGFLVSHQTTPPAATVPVN
jgi:hypothetical protein